MGAGTSTCINFGQGSSRKATSKSPTFRFFFLNILCFFFSYRHFSMNVTRDLVHQYPSDSSPSSSSLSTGEEEQISSTGLSFQINGKTIGVPPLNLLVGVKSFKWSSTLLSKMILSTGTTSLYSLAMIFGVSLFLHKYTNRPYVS